ncbi:transcription elongation factor 1 [Cystoisospora suis]|uniref:Transcription elongation factor 1 n=1 Tax=Cystoisospora suis TaxID=483139 RepID=A0A2C6KQE8_9APIC|nr:transcription elongation factor 1 [Cystoisospora suis]
MGKRKAKAPPKTRKMPKLDKEFECPFCSHPRSVGVKMDRGRGVGALTCRICGATYEKRINRLDEPIDIYGAWIDACVSANAQAAEQARRKISSLGADPLGHSGGSPQIDAESSEPRFGRDGGPGSLRRPLHSSRDDIRSSISKKRMRDERESTRKSVETGDEDSQDELDDEAGEAYSEDETRKRAEAPPSGSRLKRLRMAGDRDDDSSEEEDVESGGRTDTSTSNAAVEVLEKLRRQQGDEEDVDGRVRADALFEDDE